MEELDLKQLMSIIWRKKFIIIFVIIIFAIIGSIYSYKYVEPMYKSTTTIILGKVTSSNGINMGYDANFNPDSAEMISESDLSLNSSLIETYSELVKSKSLIEEVKSNLNINVSTDNISVSRVNTSDLLEITAINKEPKMAEAIVSEVVRIFSEKVKEIYSISNVYVIDKANVPEYPYNINHTKDIIIFMLFGVFVSLAYILVYNILDNTIKSSYDIENVLKLKTLITIPLDKKKSEELITIKESKSIISEAFRTLRTNVQFSINNKGPKTLLVTSCLPSEGKSYVSANLAITFAQAGKKVILVDSDMRKGRQAKVFNVPNQNGLSNYISNIDQNGMEINWSLNRYIKETHINNLNVITAGNVPPNPSELLESEKVVELIEELKKYYDIIIFDGAPLLPITDSLLLARLLNSTMLVAVHNKTKKDNLLKAKDSVENVGGKIIGVCLNKVSETIGEYTDNYYYYAETEKKENIFEKLLAKIELKNKVKNIINKIKTYKKRLAEKNIEHKEIINAQREEKQKIKEVELVKKAEEKAINQAKMAEEKAIKEAEEAKKREEEKARREAEKIKQAEEKAKRDAEQAEERAKKEAEAEKIREEKKTIKEAQKIVKEEKKKKRNEEFAVRKKEIQEKIKKQLEILKEKFAQNKERFSESVSIKKEELVQKYQEYSIKRKDQKIAKEAEKAKILEEKRIKQEERKIELEKERERIQAEIAKRKEEERIIQEEKKAKLEEERALQKAKLEEEKAIKQAKMAEEKAMKEAEAAQKREEEKARREAEKIKQAEEKAKLEEEKAIKQAKMAEERAIKEAEEAKKREEEKERKAKEKEDAIYTDEYLDENLYPKTKYNKF